MTPSKEHNNCSVTDSKELEAYELPDKWIKIITLKNFSKLQMDIDIEPAMVWMSVPQRSMCERSPGWCYSQHLMWYEPLWSKT
jgi:hypothetical protein